MSTGLVNSRFSRGRWYQAKLIHDLDEFFKSTASLLLHEFEGNHE